MDARNIIGLILAIIIFYAIRWIVTCGVKN